MGEDLGRLDATAQAALVRSGEASPRDLVVGAIERIERIDPELNAVVHRWFDRALREAEGAGGDGPFQGVPFVLKDLGASVGGESISLGSRVFKETGRPADADDHLVTRFRRAGLVFVGRSATAEFGMGATTETSAFGPTRNPWDTGRSPGGSSGGAAVAVATGMTPAAHGTDLGGSLRIPAAACGVVGLKPSRGRVSPGPFHTDAPGGWHTAGMITRSVRDAAALLDVMAGYEPGDPVVAPPPTRPYAQEVATDPGRLRIGVADHAFTPMLSVDAECAAAVRDTGTTLTSLGHAVEEAHPAALEESEAFTDACAAVLSTGLAADLTAAERTLGRPIGDDELEPATAQLRALGQQCDGPRLAGALDWLALHSRRVQEWWSGGYDLLLTPTVAMPAPPLGWAIDPVQGTPRTFALAHFTVFWNVTGQPAISLPLRWTPEGLPVGVQLVAAYGREDLLLRVAAQLEEAMPWAERVPPIHA